MKLLLICFGLLLITGCSHTKIHTGCDVVGKQSDGKMVAECEN